MINLRGDLKVLVSARPIDFRRGVHGLVAMVAEALQADPYCGDVFVFRSKRLDRIKLIVWDGSGMVLVSKWLEDGRFTFPPVQDGAVTLTAAQLSVLFAGLDWSGLVPKAVKRPTKVA
jgi:transposase